MRVGKIMQVDRKKTRQLILVALVMTLLSLNLFIQESSPEQKLYNETFDKLERFKYIIDTPILTHVMNVDQLNAINEQNNSLRMQFFVDENSSVARNLKLEQLEHIHKEVSVFYSLKISEIHRALNIYYDDTFNKISKFETTLDSTIANDRIFIRQIRELISFNQFRELSLDQKLIEVENIYNLSVEILPQTKEKSVDS